jgi:hypothetical protein
MNCATTFEAVFARVCFAYTLTFADTVLAEKVPSKLTPAFEEAGEETVPYVVKNVSVVSCASSTSEICVLP